MGETLLGYVPARAKRRSLDMVIAGMGCAGIVHLLYIIMLGLRHGDYGEEANGLNHVTTTTIPAVQAFSPMLPNSSSGATSGFSEARVGKENATMFMLVRNEELERALQSIRRIQDRFNNQFQYPWTFLNDVPFTREFKERVAGMSMGCRVEFGLINETQWRVPDWIDVPKAQAAMDDYESRGVIYGGSLSYRQMCRYNSGFFFHHPLLVKYDYYWRVEPDTHYHCDVLADPFEFMRRESKVYGFVMSMYEYAATITTLWESTRRFAAEHPEFIAANNSLAFLVDEVPPEEDGKPVRGEYNLCHFWSNFEIADLRFWRGEAYQTYFNYLDQLGGVFYEVTTDQSRYLMSSAGVTRPSTQLLLRCLFPKTKYISSTTSDMNITRVRAALPTTSRTLVDGVYARRTRITLILASIVVCLNGAAVVDYSVTSGSSDFSS